MDIQQNTKFSGYTQRCDQRKLLSLENLTTNVEARFPRTISPFTTSTPIALSLLALLLAACAPLPVTYTKTDAPPGEWPQVRAECMLEASEKVPANNQYSVSPGQEFSSRNCAHGFKDCSTYSDFTPPQLQTVDANDGIRKAVYQACLAKHGWLESKQN